MHKIENLQTIIKQAGAIALSYFGSVEREEKAIGNLVTEADRALERYIKAEIRKLYPDDGFIGEEEGLDAGRSADIWIIDPIDGTADFANKLHSWGVSLALYQQGKVTGAIVYMPVLNKLFKAIEGQGAFCNEQILKIRMGDFNPGNYFAANASLHIKYDLNLDLRLTTWPCALSPCIVAEGQVLGSLLLPCYIWDLAAGCFIAKEAGAYLQYLSGQELSLEPLIDGSKSQELLLCGSQEFIIYARNNIKPKR